MEGQKLGNRNRLPIHVSDTAVTSQDGSSLEFVAATEGRECNIQDARGRGLGPPSSPQFNLFI